MWANPKKLESLKWKSMSFSATDFKPGVLLSIFKIIFNDSQLNHAKLKPQFLTIF